MTDVNGVSGNSATQPIAQAAGLAGQQLTQQDFLKLMIEQFRAQDPTKPMDTSQMVGQMAQFSQITATQQMQASFSQLATSLQGDQILNASNLIGRQVLVPATQATLADNGIDGAINVPSAVSDVRVAITNADGDVVRTIDLGKQAGGLARFHWDGTDDDGKTVPAGDYSFAASNGGNKLDTYVSGQVAGIGSTGSDTYVQVDGVGGVLLSQIAQIL